MALAPKLQRLRSQLPLKLVSAIVFGVGMLLIAEVLFASHPIVHHRANALFAARIFNDAPLIVGLSFVYLSLLLRRRKQAAWLIALVLFWLYLFGSIVIRSYSDIILAVIALFGLLKYRSVFVVKSGLNSNRIAIRNALFAIILMMLYGVIGFLTLDKSAFGREISFTQSLVYTVDSFRLLGESLKPLTIDGRVLLDSLYIINFMTAVYVIYNLFGPLHERFVDQASQRHLFEHLINSYSNDSEDFFKIWPKDKHYFIEGQAGLAYKTVSGVALVVGDPVGEARAVKALLVAFIEQCHINDWTVAFVHVSGHYLDLYRSLNMDIQKLGEEAIIDLDQFNIDTMHNKHFRNIINRFDKLGYIASLLEPPHSKPLLDELKQVSDSWLSMPAKTERTFMLGYFDKEYLSTVPILIARDHTGQIVGFLNQVPTDGQEANIDLMRHMAGALPNVNDFMFINFLTAMHKKGYQKLNIGLCPLAGISHNVEEKTVVTNMLRFVYQNGNRIFGFNGLARFKNKFEPQWRNRYVAYQEGVVGFTKSMMSLNKAMQKKK